MPDITSYAAIIIKCLVAVLAAIFLGNGAVYLFNKMPAKWSAITGKLRAKKCSILLRRESRAIRGK